MGACQRGGASAVEALSGCIARERRWEGFSRSLNSHFKHDRDSSQIQT
jgi:hypothetical protein